MFKPREVVNEIAKDYRSFLKEKHASDTNSQELVKKAEAILHRAQKAGKKVASSILRQQLESYAGSCGLYINEVKGIYTSTNISDLNPEIQQILDFYSKDDEIYAEEFLLSSLKKIDCSKFNQAAIHFLRDRLVFYWVNPVKKELEEAIVCLCQVAYLQSLRDIVWLDELTKAEWLRCFNDRYVYELFANQLDSLKDWQSRQDKWQPKSDSDRVNQTSESEKILFDFYSSELAKALARGLEAFTQKNQDFNISSLSRVPNLASRVTRNTHQFIITLLKEVGDITRDLVEVWLDNLELTRTDGWEKLKEKCCCEKEMWDKLYSPQDKIDKYLDIEIVKYNSIGEYIKEQIKGKFAEKVFHESFTFEDIYTPLMGIRLDDNDGYSLRKSLEDWILDRITDEEERRKSRDQVILIEGESGSGKSTLCRKVSDQLLKHYHPLWTPVWIKLRDIEELGEDFGETLKKVLVKKGFNSAYFSENNDWLSDRNTCFVFLLDGLDELLTEQYTKHGWEVLLRQAISFQQCSGLDREKPKHQVLITSRPIISQHLTPVAEQLERVKIKEIDEAFQEKWLEKWKKFHLSEKWLKLEKSELQKKGLSDNNVADEIEEKITQFQKSFQRLKKFLKIQQSIPLGENWIKEPLLLYLLAAMWRDEQLDKKGFQKISPDLHELKPNDAKIHIYQNLLDWLIEVRGLEKWVTSWEPKIENKKVLKIIITEMGLCAIQLGGTRTLTSLLESRLISRDLRFEKPAQEVLEKKKKEDISALVSIKEETKDHDDNDRILLQFNHQSFSEFLYAQRLQESLENWIRSWSECEESKISEFLIADDRMDWEIYDLLGFGGLTQKIVEYLKHLLRQSQILNKDKLEQLFCRLNSFYQRWFESQFVSDQLHFNLPHAKMVQLLEPLNALGLSLTCQEIDLYTELNVLILLLELSRLTQEPFHPCGFTTSSQQVGETTCLGEQAETFELRSRLLRLISYSRWLGGDVFVRTVGSFLESINLRQANLRGADLAGVNLNTAYLSGAHLDGINLSNARLNNAFLGNAQLHVANLSNAELKGAFLGNANLSNADLKNADLSRAVLVGANLRTANLVHAKLEAAYLGDADLSNANLQGANLNNANLSCANLSEANLEGADLSDANLTAVIMTQGTNLSRCVLREINLRGEDLHSAKLSEADLNKAYLSGTRLNRINLGKASLNGTFLGNVQLHSANLSNTELKGAFLGNANLENADLEDADLFQAVLVGANLRNAYLVHAKLEATYMGDADLSYANLRGANLNNANLSCANLSEANLEGADLSGANLTAVIMTQGTNLRKIQWNDKTMWEWKNLEPVQKDQKLEEEMKKHCNTSSNSKLN